MDNRKQKEEEKTLKYAPLRLELKRQHPVKALVGSDRYREVLRIMQKAVLSHTFHIAKTFKLVVYYYKCGSCDADYVGSTARHLHQRKKEHQYSAIGKHRWEEHGLQNKIPDQCFTIVKKCKTKFDCLLYEMMFIIEKSPSLNTN